MHKKLIILLATFLSQSIFGQVNCEIKKVLNSDQIYLNEVKDIKAGFEFVLQEHSFSFDKKSDLVSVIRIKNLKDGIEVSKAGELALGLGLELLLVENQRVTAEMKCRFIGSSNLPIKDPEDDGDFWGK